MMIFFSQCYDNYVFLKVLLEQNSVFVLPFAPEVSISEARREDKKQEVPEVIGNILQWGKLPSCKVSHYVSCPVFFCWHFRSRWFSELPKVVGICYIVSWRVLLAQKLTYPLNPLKNVGWKTIFSFFWNDPFSGDMLIFRAVDGIAYQTFKILQAEWRGCVPSLKLTARPWKRPKPQKERNVFQPSILRCELLVSERVVHVLSSCICMYANPCWRLARSKKHERPKKPYMLLRCEVVQMQLEECWIFIRKKQIGIQGHCSKFSSDIGVEN